MIRRRYLNSGIRVPELSSGYLTFRALEDNVLFSIDNFNNESGPLYYSINGDKWKKFRGTTETINNGDNIYWYGNGMFRRFVSSGDFTVSGNLLSLCGREIWSTDSITFLFESLFENCTNLISAYNLQFPNVISSYCYTGMFKRCISLIEAPISLHYDNNFSDTLKQNCYDSMFEGCTSLVTPPEIIENGSALWCCRRMFANCTSLTYSPIIKCTMTRNGFEEMFDGCTSLSEITCTSVPNSNNTQNWVRNVASNGIFYEGFVVVEPWTIGNSGIPTGWLVVEPEYLTFKAIEDTTFTFTLNALQYSLDNGITWTTLASGTASPIVTAGNKILWKQTRLTPTSSAGIGTFSSTGNFEVSGNIMSLYYGDDFIGQKNLTGKNSAFRSLFNGNTRLVNAENLILPATTLGLSCYFLMFKNCTSLISGPTELPATTLVGTCYGNMFEGCSALTNPPNIFATTLAWYCCRNMFEGCTSLVNAPELHTITLAENCYICMFKNCTALIEAPELPTTSLTKGCYYGMFNGCTSLTLAPELPATILAEMCYLEMFKNCTALIEIPELLATTLTNQCYFEMFYGCTSLTTAPELPATTLTTNCYQSMFNGCTSLNYIKCLATNISASDCTRNWVQNIASSGIFIKANSMDNWSIGSNGIPVNWTIENFEEKIPLTFEVLESGTFSFSRNDLQYSVDDGATWSILTAGSNTPTLSSGDKIMWKQTGLTPATSHGIGTFSSTGNFKAYGNVMSLYYGDDFIGQTDLTGKTFAFCDLFKYCSKLTDASNMVLPATILSSRCYDSMFKSCYSLTKSPALPATTLAMSCYLYMFAYSGLEVAPKLPATTLTSSCYQSMFSDCTHLTTPPVLPSTSLSSYCYQYMFQNCTALTIAPELPATTLMSGCYDSMFSGCTSLTTAPELPATTLTNDCYEDMFYGCSSLNYIKCFATDISASYCTSNWLKNVAATGTFVKADNMSSWTTGISGIPSGWTVINAS